MILQYSLRHTYNLNPPTYFPLYLVPIVFKYNSIYPARGRAPLCHSRQIYFYQLFHLQQWILNLRHIGFLFLKCDLLINLNRNHLYIVFHSMCSLSRVQIFELGCALHRKCVWLKMIQKHRNCYWKYNFRILWDW